MQVVTPSGIEVRYRPPPKRAYWVRALEGHEAEGDAYVPAEEDGWIPVPSVTTVLGCLDKPALPWWGMRVGVEGVLDLLRRGIIYETLDGLLVADSGNPFYVRDQDGNETDADVENVTRLLTAYKLTVNHQRDKAGDRGTAAHEVLEVWAQTGITPQAEHYPENQRGYVLGLLAFFKDYTLDATEVELMLGSVEHLYAGRCDIRGYLHHKKAGAGKGPLVMLDLKTSKNVHKTHFLQLEAYDYAAIECGYGPTEQRVVLHVTQDGEYSLHVSSASIEDFLAVRKVYDVLTRKVAT